MGFPQCNTTLEDMKINEVPVWHNYTFHYLGLWLSAVFGLIAIVVSFFLIYMHATHYLRPYEQRHIIRILFMVPVYAAVSFLSYKYYTHSVYFEVLRDCYEAFAIASFFSLLCAYIAEDLHTQKQYFRTITPKNWVWPMGWIQKCSGGKQGVFRVPRSGLTWFNVIWVCVFQYCFIRVTMTIVAVVTQVFDRYCLESLNPAFAHVWVMVIEAAAVTVAMYCLIQFYIQIKGDIQEHSPLQKITAIKLVIFLSFWQSLLISFLTSAGAIKPSDKFQTPDIKIGIPAMLLCIEMAIFAVFHIFAFSWKPYVIGGPKSSPSASEAKSGSYKGGPFGAKALLDAFNPWDLIKAVGRSARWLFVGRKTRQQDISYQGTKMEVNPKHNDPEYVHEATDTAYHPNQSTRPISEDHETLLAAPQPYATQYGQGGSNTSPYRSDSDEYFPSGDIGAAQLTQDGSRYHTPQQTPGTKPSYQKQQYRPNPHQAGQDYGTKPPYPRWSANDGRSDDHQYPDKI